MMMRSCRVRNNQSLLTICAIIDAVPGDMRLMRKCPCPVWIVKPTEHHTYRRILAAVDTAEVDAMVEEEATRIC